MKDDISKIIREVKEMEKEQDDAKLEHSRLTGQHESEVDRLKLEFKVSNVDEAEKMLNKLQKRLAKIDEQITIKYTDLKEKYNVNNLSR